MAMRIRSIPRRSTQSMVAVLTGILGGAVLATGLLLPRSELRASEDRNSQPIIAAYDMVEVPVPIEPVPSGTALREIALRKVSYPRHQVPEGALIEVYPFRDHVSLIALPARMPLFAENFSPRRNGFNSVVARIPPGMRAMTVRVDATSAVEGWAGSGSVVDVLLIAHEKTTVIAEQVKVLSAERIVTPVEETGTPSVPSTVTLLVDQDQCLAINTAIPLGRIAFALRSPDDTESWSSAEYTAERLKSGDGATTGKAGGISGLLSVPGAEGNELFALSGDRWIQTSVIPEGFRIVDPVSASRLQEGSYAAKKHP